MSLSLTPAMRAISSIPIGPARDMAPGMGSDMAMDLVTGEIRSDTMECHTGLLGWAGMAALGERNAHRVRRGPVQCRHLALQRNSEKSPEMPA